MTADERKLHKQEWGRRYRKSAKGRAARAKQVQSPTFKAYRAAYSKSDSFKKSHAKWAHSEKGKLIIKAQNKRPSAKKAQAKYQRSEQGKTTAAINRKLPKNKKRVAMYDKRRAKTPAGKWKEYRSNAKVRSLSFELTFDQFMLFWQKPCHYCGDPIETSGLDRIDNALGYVIANVQPCCTTCNMAKKKRDAAAYIAHCVKVAKHLGVV